MAFAKHWVYVALKLQKSAAQKKQNKKKTHTYNDINAQCREHRDREIGYGIPFRRIDEINTSVFSYNLGERIHG